MESEDLADCAPKDTVWCVRYTHARIHAQLHTCTHSDRRLLLSLTHWRREQLKSEVADVFKYLLEDVADQSIRHADLLRSLRTAFEAIARLLSASNCIRKLVRAGTPRRSAMPIMRVGIPPRLAGARVCSRLDGTGDPARRVFRKARAAAACYVCVRAILPGPPHTSPLLPYPADRRRRFSFRGSGSPWVAFDSV